MAVFKKENCKACSWNKNESAPKKEAGECPKCGGKTYYSENWYMSFKHNGKKTVKSIGPQKRLAQDAYGKAKSDIRENRHFDKAPSTPWRKAVSQFEDWIEINVRPHTKRMYKNSLKHLNPVFEDYTLDKIAPVMVEQYKNKRAAKVKAASVNRELATIKRIFSLAEEWGLVELNFIRKVSLLEENNSRVRYLTNEEIKNLLTHCKEGKVHLAVQIALNTGLRKEGVMTLRWAEIDFERNMITKKVKGGKEVHIPLSASLRDALVNYRKSLKGLSPFVLPGRKLGQPLKDIKISFHAALDKAGITDFRFHDLRHTFASHFIMKTKDIKALQEILGHSDIKMTMRYSHLMKEHLTAAMEIFDSDPVNHQARGFEAVK